MTGGVLGFFLGLGGLLIVAAFTRPVTSSRVAKKVRGHLSQRTDVLREAGIDGVTGLHLTFMQVGAGLLAGMLVLLISSSFSVSVCFVVFGFFTPVAMVRRLSAKRVHELRSVWPEAVDHLASGVRAGLSLPEAVSALAIRGPEPLRLAFGAFAADYRVSGRFAECLDRLKTRLADPVGDRVCESLRLARDVGGSDLGRLLRTLSTFLRDDARTRAELETRQGWTINAARLAVASPWAVLLLLATDSTTLTAFDTTGGRILLATGGGVSVLAYRMMLRIGRLPREERILR